MATDRSLPVGSPSKILVFLPKGLQKKGFGRQTNKTEQFLQPPKVLFRSPLVQQKHTCRQKGTANRGYGRKGTHKKPEKWRAKENVKIQGRVENALSAGVSNLI
jgi:hypothetical protein